MTTLKNLTTAVEQQEQEVQPTTTTATTTTTTAPTTTTNSSSSSNSNSNNIVWLTLYADDVLIGTTKILIPSAVSLEENCKNRTIIDMDTIKDYIKAKFYNTLQQIDAPRLRIYYDSRNIPCSTATATSSSDTTSTDTVAATAVAVTTAATTTTTSTTTEPNSGSITSNTVVDVNDDDVDMKVRNSTTSNDLKEPLLVQDESNNVKGSNNKKNKKNDTANPATTKHQQQQPPATSDQKKNDNVVVTDYIVRIDDDILYDAQLHGGTTVKTALIVKYNTWKTRYIPLIMIVFFFIQFIYCFFYQ